MRRIFPSSMRDSRTSECPLQVVALLVADAARDEGTVLRRARAACANVDDVKSMMCVEWNLNLALNELD